MSRFARKADRNQPAIVEALRRAGAQVHHVHRLPGSLDILVGFRGRLYWAELKEGSEGLTDAEQEVIDRFRRVGVELPVWRSADDALRGIGAI